MADSIEVLRAALRYIEHTANGKQELLVEQMRNAIRALSPAGGDWVMVPRKADDAMKLAGWKVIDNAGDRCHQVWNAMLAASPQQEPGPAINSSETYSKPIADTSGQTLASQPATLPSIDALMPSLGTDDPAFSAWRDSVPDKHWARVDLSALRIGYELGKLSAAPQPQDRLYPECSGDPMDCPENEGFGCCKTVPPVFYVKQDGTHGEYPNTAQDPSGQTLAGAGGDGGAHRLAARIGMRYTADESCDIGAPFYAFTEKELDKFVNALTATSAGTTGDDSEDAARLPSAQGWLDSHCSVASTDWMRGWDAAREALDAGRRARGEG